VLIQDSPRAAELYDARALRLQVVRRCLLCERLAAWNELNGEVAIYSDGNLEGTVGGFDRDGAVDFVHVGDAGHVAREVAGLAMHVGVGWSRWKLGVR
jgi:hypothetical protein